MTPREQCMCNMTANMTDASGTSQALDNIGWDHPNIPFAIGLSLGAGLATAIGGSLVFFPEMLKRVPQATLLAVSLALSAGVMIYVSFIEIFAKSYKAIAETPGISESGASAITTLFFFLGMLFCVLLEVVVHKINSDNGGVPHDVVCAAHAHPQHIAVAAAAAATSTAESGITDAPRSGDDEESATNERRKDKSTLHSNAEEVDISIVSDAKGNGDAATSGGKAISEKVPGAIIGDPEEQRSLQRMGLMTAAAIAIHNFPEGLATFLATVSSTKLGASLSVAIAVHNIPEGLCVAMPIYYATGSARKAFLWSMLSGLTEPIGGMLGFAVLQPVFTPMVFGIIFSMVGGMMVFIVCHELLPAAHRYMGNGAKATMWLMIGMLIMATSLVLFVL